MPVSGARDLYGPVARPCAGEEGAAVKVTEALLAELEALLTRAAVIVQALRVLTGGGGGKG
ncbi:hypothetical protein K400107F7_31870 [Agathobaculum massiliense]